jgi:hypothetical protein
MTQNQGLAMGWMRLPIALPAQFQVREGPASLAERRVPDVDGFAWNGVADATFGATNGSDHFRGEEVPECKRPSLSKFRGLMLTHTTRSPVEASASAASARPRCCWCRRALDRGSPVWQICREQGSQTAEHEIGLAREIAAECELDWGNNNATAGS